MKATGRGVVNKAAAQTTAFQQFSQTQSRGCFDVMRAILCKAIAIPPQTNNAIVVSAFALLAEVNFSEKCVSQEKSEKSISVTKNEKPVRAFDSSLHHIIANTSYSDDFDLSETPIKDC